MQRNFLKAMLCAVGTLALASSAFAAEAVKIGVTQPLTGAFAAAGNYVAQGAKVAAEADQQGRRRARQEDRARSSRTTSPTRPRPSPRPRS